MAKQNGKRIVFENKDPCPGRKCFAKIAARFICNNGDCRRKWCSIHAWEGEAGISKCKECDTEGKYYDVKDKKTILDNYRCSKCGNYWQSLPVPTGELKCDSCGVMVSREGTQIRYIRHFWLACANPNCRRLWEDFSVDFDRFGQRCSKCKSSGRILMLTIVRAQEDEHGERIGPEPLEGRGIHQSENCDMCQAIRSQKKGSGCPAAVKVVVEQDDSDCRIVQVDRI